MVVEMKSAESDEAGDEFWGRVFYLPLNVEFLRLTQDWRDAWEVADEVVKSNSVVHVRCGHLSERRLDAFGDRLWMH